MGRIRNSEFGIRSERVSSELPTPNSALRTRKGQIVLEYFILFAAIAAISILGILVLSGRRLPTVVQQLDSTIPAVDLRGGLQAYFSQAADRISK